MKSKDTSGKVQLDWEKDYYYDDLGGYFIKRSEFELGIYNPISIKDFISEQLTKAYQEGEKAGKEEHKEYGQPRSTFIQWKGTDLCMDWICECGEGNHEDRDFCYDVKCDSCGKEFNVGDSVILTLKEPEQVVNTKEK